MLRGSLEEVYEEAAREMVDAARTMHTTTVEMIRVFCPDQSKLATYKDAVLKAIPDLSTMTGGLKSRIKAFKRRTSKTETTDDGVLETFGLSVKAKLPMPAAERPSRNESVASVTVYCQGNKCDAIFKKLADRCDEDFTRKVVDQRIQELTSSKIEES
ncbi:uncharacterized protein LOC124268136 [Haliotis rubra]|uniref:uncharacterized protein LOC124268136 n=1 Tax=Haliotis rubra TaxID=36100 RepID=UPI001EE550A1|nr:uncharacterized protein LOC124268136 [Haliotis rubra]